MNWFKKMKLSLKLSLLLSLPLLLVFACLVAVNLKQLHTVSLTNGELEAEKAGTQFTQAINEELLEMQSLLQSLSVVLLDVRAQKRMTRSDIVQILGHELDKRPDVLGIYTLWEPNAYDNNDKAHIRKAPYEDATGRFLPYVARSNGAQIIEPLKDYEQEGPGDYYLLPKKNKKLTLLEPYTYQVNGNAVLMTSIVLPLLDEQGVFLGIVGVDVALNTLQEKAEKDKPASGYVTVVSNQGKFIAHGAQPSKVSTPYASNETAQAVWRQIKEGGVMLYGNDDGGQTVLRNIQQIHIDGSDETWYIETVIPKVALLKQFNDNVFLSVTLVAAALVILIALIVTIVRVMFVRRIKQMMRLLQKLADGDFTETMEVKFQDEFGIMAGQFNQMIATLRQLLQSVHALSTSVGSTSHQLSVSAEETNRATQNTVASIEMVASGAEVQEQQAEEAAKSTLEMASAIERVAESTSLVAEATKEVLEQTETGNRRIGEAVRQMGVITEAMNHTEATIAVLARKSDEIGGILGMITHISTQTNLLALNAGIEAARVGEHGRGFAVVATEIRKLAEQTKTATEEIGQLIADIREETASAMKAMSESSAETVKGVQSVNESGALFQSITRRMGDVNQQVDEVSAATEQMSAGAEEISATMDQSAVLAKDAASNAQSIAAASQQTLASMEEISASAESLSQMIQQMLDQMSKFKV